MDAAIVSNLVDKLVEKLEGWLEGLVGMLPNLVVATIVAMVFGYGGRYVGKTVHSLLLKVSKNEPISQLMGTLARIATLVVGLFIALGMLDLDKTVTSLLAGVGVIGLALGFAFQDIAANLMSGFIMAIRRPFDVGDTVEIGGHCGQVERVELRATGITTLDGLSVMIPNKDVFQNPIVNYTHTPNRRMELGVGVAYDSDLERVREVALRAVEDLENRDEGKNPELYFGEFGDSSINFTLFVWLSAADQKAYLHARSEAVIAIKKAFDAEGITIPFPIRTLDFGAGAVGGEQIDGMELRIAGRGASAAQ